MKRQVKSWLFIALMLAGMVVPFLPTDSAQAFSGRGEWRGYFNNTLDDFGHFVMRNGLHPTGATSMANANDFITEMKNALNGTNEQDQTGAEFIILTMLGRNPGAANAIKSQAHNAAVIADWEARVRYYAQQGWVDWTTTAGGTVQNTYWQGGPGPNDVAWYGDPVSGASFTFHKPGTTGYYEIRKECANPLGDLDGLALPAFDVNLVADRNGSAADVAPGQTYRVGVQVTNTGPATSDPGVIQVMYPGAAIVRPCAGSCALTPPNMTALYGGYAGNKGFRTFDGVPASTGNDNWYWDVKAMPDNAVTGAVMQFTVAAGAAVNSTITFHVYYYPANLSGAVEHKTVTFTVVSLRSPSVVSQNADVHAGGGLCRQTLTGGFVKGAPGAASGNEYVVSSSATINDFKSNGTGTDNLRQAAYDRVCRPDLLAAASAYRNSGGAHGTIGGASTTLSLACLTTVGASCGSTTGGADVYFFDGADLFLSGQINRKVTIVATVGNVHFTGNTTISTASFARNNVPSLGVIAKNTIDIRAAATLVEAYLFSNGLINTCSEATVACATLTLRINGFVMAQNLRYNRLGPVDTNGSPVAEQVVLNPQIYLNPPKLFDASVDDILLQGQGEKQPLF